MTIMKVSLARKMATVDRVQELLEKIRAASWDHAVQGTTS
jgi:oligopeptidase A